MKTLMNLKLFAMSLLLWAGMTSCLKSSDPDFMVVPDVAYLEQTGSGDNARYYPVVRIVGNYAIQKATCSFEGMPGTFSPIFNNSYYMECEFPTPVSTLTTGVFSISATSAEEQPRSASYQFTFNTSEQLGYFDVDGTLQYDEQKQTITGTWSESENATAYVLMYQMGHSQIFVPYGEFNYTTEDGKVTGSIPFSVQGSDGTCQIAVAAVNDSAFLIKGIRSLTISE